MLRLTRPVCSSGAVAAALSAAALGSPPHVAYAQSAPTAWTPSIESYGWLTSMTGTAGAGSVRVPVNASFSNTLKQADSVLAFSGHAEVRRGPFAVWARRLDCPLDRRDRSGQPRGGDVPTQGMKSLQYFKHFVCTAIRLTPPLANCDDLVQSDLCWSRRLEEDRDAVIDKFRIDVLTPGLALQQFGRTVAHPARTCGTRRPGAPMRASRRMLTLVMEGESTRWQRANAGWTGKRAIECIIVTNHS